MSSSRIEGGRENYSILARGGLWVALSLLLMFHAAIHYGVVVSSQPVTLREQAFIVQSEAVLDAAAPRMYSWESVPQGVNLYGPLYPLLASGFVAANPDHPYVAHRVFVAICLVIICVLLGVAVTKSMDLLAGFFAATVFYCINVASPSIAAGPDLLAVLFYMAGIVVLHGREECWRRQVMALGFCVMAFFTKPYCVLLVPALLGYVWFVSGFRRTLPLVAGVIVAILAIGLAVEATMPAYGFSVLRVHSYFSTRDAATFWTQLIEFFYLNIAAIILGMFCFPWRRILTALRDAPWRAWVGAGGFGFSPGFAAWMVLVALGALVLSLGWHGGAYLIYYNHLLLGPLLILAFSDRQPIYCHYEALKMGLMTVTIGVLSVLCPAFPASVDLPDVIKGRTAWVDPYLDSYVRGPDSAKFIDNAQSEYAVHAGFATPNSEAKRQVDKYLLETVKLFKEDGPDLIILCGAHDRPIFRTRTGFSDFLLKYYEPKEAFLAYPYFAPFRERSLFGRTGVRFVVLSRRPEHGVPPSSE